MSRFSQPQDPVFRQLNASITFDWRLAPYDVEQSRAHATMLAAAGIISEADRLQNLVNRMLGPNALPKRQLVNIHEVLERVRQIVRAAAPTSARSRGRRGGGDPRPSTRIRARGGWAGPGPG